MNSSLDLSNYQISGDRVLQQLRDSQLLPQLVQEIAIDDLVKRHARSLSIDLSYTQIEFEQLSTELLQFPFCQGMNSEQLIGIIDRQLKLKKFKQAKWGDEVADYFCSQKDGLDRVVLSILQVSDALLAQELYFRIQAGEQSFTEIALDYSESEAAQDGGIVGPMLVRDLPPDIRAIICKLTPGEVTHLFKIEQLYTYFRLDELSPAELDDRTNQLLLDELFDLWIKEINSDTLPYAESPLLMLNHQETEVLDSAERIISHLTRSGLLVKYVRELIITETVTKIESDLPDIASVESQNILLEQFKRTKWGHAIKSRFLVVKSQLDRVLFSSIEVTDLSLAQELYLLVSEQGYSLNKLAKTHSQNQSAKLGGVVGPVSIAHLHPLVQHYLTRLEPKQLSPIFPVGERYIFLRLDRLLPSKFDLQVEQLLLNELFNHWLEQQIVDLIGKIRLLI
jgi:parvulin-like peptidyl-prolyl isomerase